VSKVLMVTSECVPFAKTGGLADAVAGLSQALVNLGQEVTVFLPHYGQTKLQDVRNVIPSITVPFEDHYRYCSILDGGIRFGVRFYFVEYAPFFDRDTLYHSVRGGSLENAKRFALYSRAVLEATKILGVPDVFHCHDWQSALLPVLLRSVYAEDPAYTNVPVIFTVHNLGYQGLFPPEVLPLLHLPWNLFTPGKLEFFGEVNFLKGGLVLSDFITTVSKRYCQEIQDPEFGLGLEGVLKMRAATLTGILNGVDYAQWDPATDGYLTAHYSPQDLTGKKECRTDLLHAFGLNHVPETTPVIAIVSRLATQKGFDIVAAVAEEILRRDVAVVALGTGEPRYEDFFRQWALRYPDRVAVQIRYDEALAHKIEAGADMFLMPSRYEPCGLNQFYSLRYGTVPIVRATGGLDDSVEQWNLETQRGTGFKFADYRGEALLSTIDDALITYKDQSAWHVLMRNGMALDYSWGYTAREYLRVYSKVCPGFFNKRG
jgi:starch synthase